MYTYHIEILRTEPGDAFRKKEETYTNKIAVDEFDDIPFIAVRCENKKATCYCTNVPTIFTIEGATSPEETLHFTYNANLYSSMIDTKEHNDIGAENLPLEVPQLPEVLHIGGPYRDVGVCWVNISKSNALAKVQVLWQIEQNLSTSHLYSLTSHESREVIKDMHCDITNKADNLNNLGDAEDDVYIADVKSSSCEAETHQESDKNILREHDCNNNNDKAIIRNCETEKHVKWHEGNCSVSQVNKNIHTASNNENTFNFDHTVESRDNQSCTIDSESKEAAATEPAIVESINTERYECLSERDWLQQENELAKAVLITANTHVNYDNSVMHHSFNCKSGKDNSCLQYAMENSEHDYSPLLKYLNELEKELRKEPIDYCHDDTEKHLPETSVYVKSTQPSKSKPLILKDACRNMYTAPCFLFNSVMYSNVDYGLDDCIAMPCPSSKHNEQQQYCDEDLDYDEIALRRKHNSGDEVFLNNQTEERLMNEYVDAMKQEHREREMTKCEHARSNLTKHEMYNYYKQRVKTLWKTLEERL